MRTLPPALVSITPTGANQRLLGTALAGLLCLAAANCSTKEEGQDASSTAGAGGMPGSAGAPDTASGTAGTSERAGAPTSGGSSSVAGAGGASAAGRSGSPSGGVSDTAGMGGAAVAGAGGAAPEPPHITSSKAAGLLSADDFKALCDERGGTVEVMPHCGGFATAKGFSYDTGTQELSEHTCKGANTCGGWNCVIVD